MFAETCECVPRANGEVVIWTAKDRKVADAVNEVGFEEYMAAVDVWSAFMKHVGWKNGDKILPGMRKW